MATSGLKTARNSLKSVRAHLPDLSYWQTRSDHDARAEINSPESPIARLAPEPWLGSTCQKRCFCYKQEQRQRRSEEAAKETIKTLHPSQNTFPGLQKQAEMKAGGEAVQDPVGEDGRSSPLRGRARVWGEKAPFGGQRVFVR